MVLTEPNLENKNNFLYNTELMKQVANEKKLE